MKRATDFRRIARESLRGYWGIAVIAGLLATLLGGISSGGGDVEFQQDSGDVSGGWVTELFQKAESFWSSMDDGTQALIVGAVLLGVLVSLAVAVALFVVGNVVGTGYYKFNLNLVDREEEPKLNTLFQYFPHWKTLAVAKFLQNLYVFLWTLLLFIPGIIAAYSYAMTGYILAENPQMRPSEALRLSKNIMEGNRWRLFCLEISFFGWSLLCVFTLGIGTLWLTPYVQAAQAAFYRDVSDTERPAKTVPAGSPYGFMEDHKESYNYGVK